MRRRALYQNERGFITEWSVSGDVTARTISLPLISSVYSNFVVDWGDGTKSTITYWNSVNKTHTYSNDGIYNVECIGSIGYWSFNDTGDKLKCTDIIYWGDTPTTFYALSFAFKGCSNLKSTGNGSIHVLGSSNVSFFQVFNLCTSLTTINKELLEVDGYKMNTINSWFANCSSLLSIPEGIFDTCINVITANIVFNLCTSLTTFPDTLLKNLTLLTTATSFFQSCGNISRTLNADFFRYNTKLENISGFFYNTKIYGALPIDLFRYNTELININSMFYGNNISDIPVDFFRYNIKLQSVQATFRFCTNIRSLPEDLFYYNPLIYDYSLCFSNTSYIVLPNRIFNLSSLTIVSNFTNFLFVSSTFVSPTGTIQDIWNYATSATSVKAFYLCTALTNYASIPLAWK